MRAVSFLAILLIFGFMFSCRPVPKENINLEFNHIKQVSHLVFPGLGWIGVIENDTVKLHYFSQQNVWIPDQVQGFAIPKPNQGILGMGLGSIGVISSDTLHIYIQEMDGGWAMVPEYSFLLPQGYKRVFTLKDEWELAMIGLEFDEGRLEFYYFDIETGLWTLDETASFTLPRNVDSYFSLGNNTLASTDGKTLGVYELQPEGGWAFAEELQLTLPENHKGVIPFEPSIVAVIKQGGEDYNLHFYQLDMKAKQWVTDASMTFNIPAVQ